MNGYEWLHGMTGQSRIGLMAFAFVVLIAALRYEKRDPNSFEAFFVCGLAIGFFVWSSWFCLGAFVKPFNPSMEFMSGK